MRVSGPKPYLSPRVAAGFEVDWLSQSTAGQVMPPVRRLTAILAADVAGYSRLMGADEEGMHERLKAHLRDLIADGLASIARCGFTRLCAVA
jgi:class 3 adenylate cyclase